MSRRTRLVACAALFALLLALSPSLIGPVSASPPRPPIVAPNMVLPGTVAPRLQPAPNLAPAATTAPEPTRIPTPTPRRTLTAQAYLPLVYPSGRAPQPPLVSFWADRQFIMPGECATLSWSAFGAFLVTIDRMVVPVSGSLEYCPMQTHTYHLEAEFTSGSHAWWDLTIYVAAPEAQALFYAEQYALPYGGCSTLHWSVTGVTSLYLDGAGVPGVGAQQTCPLGTQFYTLEATYPDGAVAIHEVVLTAGDPGLPPGEVIAQGLVAEVVASADVDPYAPGDQPGYRMGIEGVRALFRGDSNWNYGQVSLVVPQAAIDLSPARQTHWPLRPGQGAEFRAECAAEACFLEFATEHYLYMTSE